MISGSVEQLSSVLDRGFAMRSLRRRITAAALVGILGAALTGTADGQSPAPVAPVTSFATLPRPALVGPAGRGDAIPVSGPAISPVPNPTDSFLSPPAAAVTGPPGPSASFLRESAGRSSDPA